MGNKKLRYKYSFLFFIAFLCSSIFLNIYKNNQIESALALNLKQLNNSFLEKYNKTNEISELIFYNNILYDKQLLKLVQLESNIDTYKYLKDKFYYYKKFGLSNINIYLPNNKTYLKMANYKNKYKNHDKNEILNYVNSSLKDYDSIRISNDSASMIFIKPLFDSKLKHIVSIELSFSLDYILNLMQKDSEYNFLYLINKDILNKKENKFIDFELNSNFLRKKEIKYIEEYLLRSFSSLSKVNNEKLNMAMKKEKRISILNQDSSSFFALAYFNTLTKKNNVYLLAFKKMQLKSLSNINSEFYINLFLCFFIYLLIFILLFLLKINIRKKNSVNKKYKDLIDAIDKYVVMVDTNKNGVITSVTERFCTISGYSKKELKGKNINIINHPNMPKKIFKDMWETISKGNKWEGEVMNLDKMGNSYWVKGNIFPKYNKNNKIIGYSSIRVSTTDKQQLKKINYLLKEDLSNKLNEIRMKDKSLINDTKIELMSKILDSISYQWKKPISNLSINLINLQAHLKKGDLKTNDLDNIYSDMYKEVKSLSLKLNDFSAFFGNRLENDKYNVYSAIKESIKLLRTDCKLYNISIKLDSKKDIYCFGVFHELKYIIVNLLNNSIEQISSNNISNAKINLSTVEDKDSILIKYVDNVNAKSKKIIDEVFSENYDEDINKDIGLNLNIVKLLIKKIGAKIWFENKKETTTFYIKLVSKDRRKEKRLENEN